MTMHDDTIIDALRPEHRKIVRPLRKRSRGKPMTPQAMVEFNADHAIRFMNGDFDGIMTHSLIDDPVYEFYPSRIRVSGKEAVHRYHELNYDIMIAQVDPKRRVTPATESFTFSRTFGENTYATEISGMFKLGEGEPQRGYFNAIIDFQDGKMVGERVWMDQPLSDFFVSGLKADAEFFKLPGVERF